MENQRQILLCVAGMTPQIIMETLYALTQERKEHVDEIRVITTIGGRDLIKQTLLDKTDGKFYEFCHDYNIAPESIKFDETTITLLRAPDGTMLRDIRTEEENEFAGDQICEIVEELTKSADTRLHASAAGGRKTMSIYLTAAMQLFGRAQDSLSHVLVSEEFEMRRDFFYKPPMAQTIEIKDREGNTKNISTDDAKIYLAKIPFIRLRGLRLKFSSDDKSRTYIERVRCAQDDLNYIESDYEAEIDLLNNTVNVKKRNVCLTPREMFFYAMYALKRKEAISTEDCAVALDTLTKYDFARIFEMVMEAQGDNVGIEELEGFDEYEFLKEMLQQIESRKQIDLDHFKEKVSTINSRINKKLKKEGLDNYTVALRDERGTARFGLSIAPERIKFVSKSAKDN